MTKKPLKDNGEFPKTKLKSLNIHQETEERVSNKMESPNKIKKEYPKIKNIFKFPKWNGCS